MAVPKFFEFFEVFLKVLSDDELHTAKEVRNAIAVRMTLSEDDLAQMLPSGKMDYLKTTKNWAMQLI